MAVLDEHFNDSDIDPSDQAAQIQAQAQAQCLNSVIRLRPELKMNMRNEQDDLFVVLEGPVRSKFYSVGNREYRFLSALDGKTTVAETMAKLNSEQDPLDEDAIVRICQWAVQSNLLTGEQMDATSRVERQSKAMQRQKMLAAFNPISIKFKLFNPNNLIKHITPLTGWVFSLPAVAVWVIAGLYATITAFGSWDRLSSASIGILSDFRWVWLLLIWAVLKVIHELAHGVACKKYGGEVNEAGVLLLLFTPMAYVNVTSSWRFPNRWHRIVVAAAGMYVELFIAFLALIAWSFLSDGIVSDICYNIFFMSSVTTILFNANPLMRFDGYYILADGLGIANFYTKGTRWFSDRLKHLYFGVPTTPNICPPNELRLAAIYGVLAFFWKITISLGLVIGASVLFYGLGKIMGAIGIALFFCIPIWGTIKQLYGPTAPHRPDNTRVALSTALVLFVIASMFFFVQAPGTKSSAAIVQHKDETPIRAESEGFISSILVENGQHVKQGEPLILLHNPQMAFEIEALKHEPDAAKDQARVHQQAGELALCQAEQEKLDGITKQLLEKQAELDLLQIVAPFDGFVFQRDLASKIGSFASRGDTLLNLAVEKTKEIVVPIDQRDWESLKGKSGTKMRIAIQSLPIFSASISRIDGRATDVPAHPSLCANLGGPLPIKTNSKSEDESAGEQADYLLLSPHFNVDLDLDPAISQKLKSGQRGRAFFATERQSLGGYLFVAVEDWLKNKIEMATQTATF